jgi:hypothetical protein
MKCVIMTFWQYVKIGTREALSDKEPTIVEPWTRRVIRFLLFFLVGLVLGQILIYSGIYDLILHSWFFHVLGWVGVWLLGIFAVIDALFIIGFLVVSWRKAVADCWDKFSE